MYPPKFDYAAPTTLDDALALLAEHGEEAKILAGGQSLIPMLKLRFAGPDMLIDINRVEGLDSLEETADHLIIGGMCRHNIIGHHPVIEQKWPVFAEAGKLIADPLVRNMGTIAGSLVHADPQADWGSVLLAVDAEIVVKKKGGERSINIDDFLHGIFETAIEPDEILTEIRVPKPSGKSGGAYLKMERKVGDFATAGVAVHVEMDGDIIKQAGLGLTAMGTRNLKAKEAEDALKGQKPSPELYAKAADLAAKICSPKDDTRGSAEYKLSVVRTYVQRGLERAVNFAQKA